LVNVGAPFMTDAQSPETVKPSNWQNASCHGLTIKRLAIRDAKHK
jgi:hypothetical protein